MIMPTRIFLDLDDVCNHFTMYALKYVGCPVDVSTYDNYSPKWGWDIVRAASALHPNRQFTVTEFWNLLGREIWANIPESPEFKMLLHHCEALVGTENVCILSSTVRDPDALAGKLEWIQTHFPRRMHRQFLIGPQKHFCARPDALLIDDNADNTQAFLAHGGQVILVPRPWNPLYQVSTEPYLHDALMVFSRAKKHVTVDKPLKTADDVPTMLDKFQAVVDSEEVKNE